MWGSSSSSREERKLRDEVGYYRRQAEESAEQINRMYQEQRDAEERRRAERRGQYEENLRQASSWPEALRKQIVLMGREALEEKDYPEELGTYFTDTIAGCKRALEIWPEVELGRQSEIDALMAQVEQIKFEVRQAVGDILHSEDAKFRELADMLRDREADPSSWMDW